jgi:hypothetical protein
MKYQQQENYTKCLIRSTLYIYISFITLEKKMLGARTLPTAPTGKEMQTLQAPIIIFRDFFLYLQHQYIGARWLAAPM